MGQEAFRLAGVTKDHGPEGRRVRRDRGPHPRPPQQPPRQQPPPKVTTLARSPNGSPATDREAEVEDYDCVRARQPRGENVIRSEIPLHDPAFSLSLLPLHTGPNGTRQWRQTSRPEQCVQLDNGQCRALAQLVGEGGLSRPSTSEDDDAMHSNRMTARRSVQQSDGGVSSLPAGTLRRPHAHFGRRV